MSRKSRSIPSTSRPAIALTVAAFISQAVFAGTVEDQAAHILKSWGRDTGLCAVIGSLQDDGAALATEFAATGKIIVHGIAFDEASLLKGRSLVSARRQDGFVSLELLPVNPLPYRDNLVNVMVVPDMAEAAKAGFSKEDAMRALAPWGKLFCRQDGQWTEASKGLPKETDEWTHNVHGPDGNRASADRTIRFPVGYRWNGDLPFNIDNSKRQENRYSSTRGMAVAGGRCFTFSDSVLENLRGAHFKGEELDQYVTARDAFNGMLLWRKRIGRVFYGGLWYMNFAPFAAIDDRVYTTSEKGELLVLDAKTGETVRTIATTYHPGEILVDRGVVVVATWKEGGWLGESRANTYERLRMHSGVSTGSLEAYDANTGKRLWALPQLATSIRSADGVVFASIREGADLLEESKRLKPQDQAAPAATAPSQKFKRPAQSIVALDLKNGKSLWEIGGDQLSPKDYETETLRVDAAGLGVVSVVFGQIASESKSAVLSAKTGQCLITPPGGGLPVLVDGAVHAGLKKYDPATGKFLGASRYSIGPTVCTPSYVAGDVIIHNRGCLFTIDGKQAVYAGARGACSMASVPAYGAFYTPQNWCTCCPPQISGFICFGSISGEPTEEQMLRTAAAHHGPAYGRPMSSDADAAKEWPMLRHGAQRSAATPARAPTRLDVKWKTPIPTPALDRPAAINWRECLNDPLTAPTAAGGVAAVAVMDANQVAGIDLKTGEIKWTFTLGARVDSSPTLHRGLCLFGAHDGFAYALDSQTGALRWKTRLAPGDERMVSYGKIESVWPVVGSVLASGDVVYASAGRTQGSDGGIVVRALSVGTGEPIWSKVLAPSKDVRSLRRNDLIFETGDSIQLMITRLDPNTGEARPNPIHEFYQQQDKLGAIVRRMSLLKGQLKDAPAANQAVLQQIAKLEDERGSVLESRPPGEIAAFVGGGTRASEGLIDWNWPRLGTRRYVQMNYGNLSGTLISWDERAACNLTSDRTIALYPKDKIGDAGSKNAGAPAWTHSLPPDRQVTALVLCENAAIAAGGIYPTSDKAPTGGFIAVLSRDNGQMITEKAFGAPVVFNGVAVLDQKVCAALADSTVCLLGE